MDNKRPVTSPSIWQLNTPVSGGDDVQQLCEAGEEEFLEIMALVGNHTGKTALHCIQLYIKVQNTTKYAISKKKKVYLLLFDCWKRQREIG